MGEMMRDLQLVHSTLAPAAASAAVMRAGATGTRQAGFVPTSLKILHVLRAPLGGLFRHVVDLVRGQAERGHRVGLIVDSTTGGARAEAILAELAPRLALGCERFAITRQISPRDINAVRQVSQRIKLIAPDVIHGHGAKGAALARLAAGAPHAIRVYTPHGGSLAHFSGTPRGGFYRVLEWMLKWRTDLFLFESSYIADVFRCKIGPPRGIARVVHNGIGTAEFEPVRTREDASDIVYVGELRLLKGIDVLIEALALLKQSGRLVSATIAGEGPDDAKLRAQMQQAGLADTVTFVGYRTAREAFAMGRVLVFPSLGESLPYVVLEAAAAGLPLIATAVGGVPEIFGPQAAHLIPADDLAALVAAIKAALDDPAHVNRVAQALRTRVRDEFSLSAMVEGGLAAYREAIAMRKVAQFA